MKNEFLFEKNGRLETHFGKLGSTESRKNLKHSKKKMKVWAKWIFWIEFDRPVELTQSWEGLLMANDVSTSWAEVIIRVALKMTSAQDAETSVTTNSTSENSFHPNDQIPSRYVTPGLKPFSKWIFQCSRKIESRNADGKVRKHWRAHKSRAKIHFSTWLSWIHVTIFPPIAKLFHTLTKTNNKPQFLQFALTRGLRSKMVVIQPLSACLMKPNFWCPCPLPANRDKRILYLSKTTLFFLPNTLGF